MCGIAGILQREPRHSPEQMQRFAEVMGATLTHRGPDDAGVWTSEDGRCSLAHRRLSIIEPSAVGHQPMHSGDGRSVICFNGEIYNYRELRDELEGRGRKLRTRTDTEVLLESVREWGGLAFPRLDGMFAFAQYDLDQRVLWLARDPFGEKPLYYLDDGVHFAFASELHALQQLPFFDATIEEEGLAEYLCFTYVGAPRTLYRGVSKLAPGCSLRLERDGRTAIQRYFEFSPGREPDASTRSDDDLADELEDILVRLIRRRMISDVPLGAFLSGGVDSSTVCALVRRKLDVPLDTFSMGWTGSDESEHEQARRFAEHLGTQHHAKEIAPDATSFLLHAGEVLDEPNGDSSCLPTYLLSEFARQRVTVAVSGDGGDEMFGGYGRYFDVMRRRERTAHRGRGHDAGEHYYDHMMFFGDDDLRALFGRVPAGLEAHLARLRHFVACDGGRDDLLMRMRKSDVDHYLPGAVIAKVDRMSMQHSLEVRTPFLSIELARFAERLPSDVLYRDGQSKFLLKHLASRYLPMEWLTMPKRGFGLPTTQGWGSAEMLAVVGPLLLAEEGALVSVLGRDAVTRFVDRQREAPHIYQLWAIGILESYLRARPAALPEHSEPAPIALREASGLSAQAPIVVREASEGFDQVVLFCRGGVPDWWRTIPTRVTAVTRFALAMEGEGEALHADWTEKNGRGLDPLEGHVGSRALAVFLSPADATVLTAGFCERLAALGFDSLAFGGPDEAGSVYDLSAYAEIAARCRKAWIPRGRRLDAFGRRIRRVSGRLFSSRPGRRRRKRNHAASAAFAVVEGRRPLLLAGAMKEEVRDLGAGRYRVEGADVWFSTSDHSDPRKNRATYRALPLSGRGRRAWWREVEDEAVAIESHHTSLARWIATQALPAGRLPQPGSTVALVVESLYAGGAERQWVILGRELVRRGYRVVLLGLDLGPGRAHYLPMAWQGALEVRDLSRPLSVPDPPLPADALDPGAAALTASAPDAYRRDLWRLTRDLRAIDADYVACQLDTPNVLGGMAGLLAGAERVLLSFRNVNPTHLPALHRPWLRDAYRVLAESPRIVLSGNARACNDDYAAWLDLPAERVHTVRNAFDPGFGPHVEAGAAEALRVELGIPSDALVVSGLFRISEEKDPGLFLEVARRLVAARGDVIVLQAGDGPGLDDLRQRTASLGLSDRVRWLGHRSDAATLLCASQLLLMTSRHEGLPNVLLEAQHFGVPVVATDVGGTSETIDDGASGWLVPHGDADALIERCLTLIDDGSQREAMGNAGRARIEKEFPVAGFVDETLRLLGPA